MEEDITGLIRKHTNDKLDDEELPCRFRLYSAKGEDHVDDTGKLGKKRPRVDILIECSAGRLPRKRYRFEDKRCARNRFNSKYKIEWYVAGIAEYVAGIYARRAPEAGMLGLMQSDEARYWKNELPAHLSRNVALACQSSLLDVSLVADIPDMAVSQHQRLDGIWSDADLLIRDQLYAEFAPLVRRLIRKYGEDWAFSERQPAPCCATPSTAFAKPSDPWTVSDATRMQVRNFASISNVY